ncbi:MAG: dockerin type I domain-containing protein [Acutalibacteraceae bacterium]|nr:dockerin type I domain-containing protein [Acutalibacteraceae bacterium]
MFKKKLLSLVLSATIISSLTSVSIVPASAEVTELPPDWDPTAYEYVVIGNEALVGDDFWNPTIDTYKMNYDEVADIWYLNLDGIANTGMEFDYYDFPQYKVMVKDYDEGNPWEFAFNEYGVAYGFNSNSDVNFGETAETAKTVTITFDGLKTSSRIDDPYIPVTWDEEHNFFATGSEGLFNPAWVPNAPEYQMTKGEDGIYSVEFPVTSDMWHNDYAYKVVQDGTWDVTYNESGIAVGLGTEAWMYIPEYTISVIITFNPETKCTGYSCIINEEPPTETPTKPTELHRGLPLPPKVNLPERYTDKDKYECIPSDWDGYYNVYYFEAPDEWVTENKAFKNEGFEVGFYWYCGSEHNADWPGEPAKKLSVLDENGNDIYADKNIYYAFAPSFATDIVWNNGISDSDPNYAMFKKQTEPLKVDDPMQNSLSDLIYEIDDSIEGAYIAGCLGCVEREVILESSLSGKIPQPVAIVKWKYFNPLTGETTFEPLTDSEGNYVTKADDYWEYEKVALNPYFDMDYDYVETTLKGDISGDDEVNVIDVVLLQRHILSMSQLNDEQLARADVNGDSTVDLIDVVILARMLVGITTR